LTAARGGNYTAIMPYRLRPTVLALFFVLLLTGCHGGSSTGLPGVSAQSAARAAVARTASFTVVVDPPTAGVTTPQSLVVSLLQVNGAPPVSKQAPYTMNLTAATHSCVAIAGGSLSCTATVPAPAGTVQFAITTYAGPNGTRAPIATSQVNAAVTTAGVKPCPISATSAPAKSI